MSKAKNGDTVKVHYTGKLDDGTVFDCSDNRDPLEFTIGQSQVIPGFEDVVIGMDLGETRTTTIPADRAYGPHSDDMVIEVERDKLQADVEPKVGELWKISGSGKEPMVVRVVEVTDDKVTLDANHPLAGKDLTFDIRVVDVH